MVGYDDLLQRKGEECHCMREEAKLIVRAVHSVSD